MAIMKHARSRSDSTGCMYVSIVVEIRWAACPAAMISALPRFAPDQP